MQPRLETIQEKKLLGHHVKMSLADNKTAELWRSFAPGIKQISNRLNTLKISMQIYAPSYYSNFNPATEFEKWATVEVENFDNIPKGMKPFTLPGGLYAVFDYKGSSTDSSIFQYIFTNWLPNSAYHLDNRPHFEVLGDKYKNNDASSEEEIWIPVINRSQKS